MPWTKRDIVQQAYAEIGKGDYEFDLSPELLQSGLRQLDAMMGTWANYGVRLGYAGGDGFGSIDAAADVPQVAIEALYLNLAIRLAPSFGKTVSDETKAAAKLAYDGVASWSAKPRPRTIPGYAGSGSWWGNMPVTADETAFGRDGAIRIGDA